MTIRKVILAALLVVVGVPLLALLLAVAAVQILDRANGVVVSSGDRREYLLHVPESYAGTSGIGKAWAVWRTWLPTSPAMTWSST
jgi:hypothetical protein